MFETSNYKNMIQELGTVVLAHDFDMYALKQGDVGAVVHCYQDGKTFDVEFVTGEGKTIALATLSETDIRPMRREESCMFGYLFLHRKSFLRGLWEA